MGRTFLLADLLAVRLRVDPVCLSRWRALGVELPLPGAAALWAGAVVVGGIAGSELGAHKLAEVTLRRLLAVVLAVAGLKLLLVRR